MPTAIHSPTARPIVVSAAGVSHCLGCEARAHSVCAAMPESDIARLAEVAREGTAAPGGGFIAEGDPADAFFNITQGTARLFKLLPDGRRQITGFVGVGHFLGLAVSDSYAFSAEAIEPVRLCKFSRSRLRAVLADFPAMERRLLEVAANELVAAQEQLLLLGRKTARERLASFLLAQSRMGVICGAPRRRFRLAMTRGNIADYLGLTIETISRTFTALRKDGLIDIPTVTKVVIRDPDGLEELAEGMG